MGSTSTSPPPRKKNLFKGLKRILKRKMVLVQRQEMVRKRKDQTWFPFHSGCRTQGSAQQLQQPSQTSTSYSLDSLKYFFSFSFPLEPFPSSRMGEHSADCSPQSQQEEPPAIQGASPAPSQPCRESAAFPWPARELWDVWAAGEAARGCLPCSGLEHHLLSSIQL